MEEVDDERTMSHVSSPVRICLHVCIGVVLLTMDRVLAPALYSMPQILPSLAPWVPTTTTQVHLLLQHCAYQPCVWRLAVQSDFSVIVDDVPKPMLQGNNTEKLSPLFSTTPLASGTHHFKIMDSRTNTTQPPLRFVEAQLSFGNTTRCVIAPLRAAASERKKN